MPTTSATGAQFGMLIAYLEDGKRARLDMELRIWKPSIAGQKSLRRDEAFAERARGYVVKLQGGDDHCRTMWKKLVDMTMEQNQRIYDRLNVPVLTAKGRHGRSLYNPMLPQIVADLQAKGLAVGTKGPWWSTWTSSRARMARPMGVIIRKKDGGFLYTTTDIACAKYRRDPGRRPGALLHRLPPAPAPDAGLDHHPQGRLCAGTVPWSTTPSA